MKKLFAVLFVIAFILPGCTAAVNAPLPATTNGQSNVAVFTVEPTAAATIEPTDEPTIEPTAEPTPEPANVVFKQKTFKVWKDSIKSIWISLACEIENQGGSAASISGVTFTLLDKEGAVLATEDADLPVPDIIGHGETAYAYTETILDNVTDPKAVASIEVNGNFSPTENKRTLLDVSGEKFFPAKKSYDDPKVTGWLTNNSDTAVDDVWVACALYDKDGNLLCVLDDHLDSTINPGSKVAFDASALTTPPNISKSVATVKCVAYQWDFTLN